VLIAGGYLSSNYLTTAEIFDPSGVGTFADTGSMAGGHAYHTASSLPSGKVLIAGGSSTFNPLTISNTGVIFNPAAGSFSSAGTMIVARNYYTAVALTNGTILLAGGNNTSDLNWASKTAEIYDPAFIAATPAVVSFADFNLYEVPAPTPQTQVILISNTGTSSLTLGSIAISPDQTNFQITANTCVASLAAASSCSVSVKFEPSTSGNKSATLVVTSNDPEKPVMSIPLTGKGIGYLAKTHTGNFTQGQSGAQYALTVTNTGSAATAGTVTVTDTLPAGLTATAINGTGWDCSLATLSCTRSGDLEIGDSFPTISLTVNVSGSAPATVLNTASVDINGTSNTASDSTVIDPILRYNLDVTITGTGGGSVTGSNMTNPNLACSKLVGAIDSFCSASFDAGTIVTLTAIPDSTTSTFGGWSALCSTNPCNITMNGPKTTTAAFSEADKVRIGTTPYTDLATAFSHAADGEIHARAIEFSETETISVTLPTIFKGGWDTTFSNNSGNFTKLDGKLTIGAGGRLTVERLVIR
jgi:uncharacterized repeat protein (TIGR01451 family)